MVAGLTSENSGLPSEVTARSKSLYRVTSARSPSEALPLMSRIRPFLKSN